MKRYILDTSFFRYFVDKNTAPSLKRSSKSFWQTALLEAEAGKAVIVVPEDLKRELEVQSFSHSKREKRKIAEILEIVQITSPKNLNQDTEYVIRKMNAYIKMKFRDELNTDSVIRKIGTYVREVARGKIREELIAENKIPYSDVSGARIVYSAYEEGGIVVTTNVKDFLIYPLLFPVNEERLYDLRNNKPIIIPESAYHAIHNDGTFKEYLAEFFQLNRR